MGQCHGHDLDPVMCTTESPNNYKGMTSAYDEAACEILVAATRHRAGHAEQSSVASV
jgi:hypothetical protein